MKCVWTNITIQVNNSNEISLAKQFLEESLKVEKIFNLQYLENKKKGYNHFIFDIEDNDIPNVAIQRLSFFKGDVKWLKDSRDNHVITEEEYIKIKNNQYKIKNWN